MLGTKQFLEYGIEDNASTNLASAISAATLSIPLVDGSSFPQTISGVATAGGGSTILVSTGIQAAGVVIGDFIRNITDGSSAIVRTVSVSSVTTTIPEGGSDNKWQTSDEWVVDSFVITAVQFNTTNDPTSGVAKREKILIDTISGNILTVNANGRGYDGSIAQSFDSNDNIYLFAKRLEYEGLSDGIKDLFVEILDKLDKNGDVAMDNNASMKARDNADSADIEVWKLDASDVLQMLILPRLDSGRVISNNNDVADKLYVDTTVAASTSTIQVTLGETVAIGDALYLKASDSKWYKTDATGAGEQIEAFVGWAQSAGILNDVINLDTIIDSNQSGLTPGTRYYLSDTAGALSSSPGTNEKIIGMAISATEIVNMATSRRIAGTISDIGEAETGTTQVTLGFRPAQLMVQGRAKVWAADNSGLNAQATTVEWNMFIVDGQVMGAAQRQQGSGGPFEVFDGSEVSELMTSDTVDATTQDVTVVNTITCTLQFALTNTGFSYTKDTSTTDAIRTDAVIELLRWVAIE